MRERQRQGCEESDGLDRCWLIAGVTDKTCHNLYPLIMQPAYASERRKMLAIWNAATFGWLSPTINTHQPTRRARDRHLPKLSHRQAPKPRVR